MTNTFKIKLPLQRDNLQMRSISIFVWEFIFINRVCTLLCVANNWMIKVFKNANSVIQFTDKESGTITGRYLLGAITEGPRYEFATYVYALMKIQVKEGAAKIKIAPESFQYVKAFTLYTREKAQKDIQLLMDSFEKAIKKEESSDW